jgi:dihydroorotate dehydrogenase (fumarate)
MADLSTQICGVKFPSVLVNAAGAKDVSESDLSALGESAAGAIVIKTATAEFRSGNDTPRWHVTELGSVNSMGLPNLGYQRYVELMPKLKEFGKPLIGSLSGMNEGDNEKMIEAYDAAGVDLIEVNLSCPNLAGKGQMGYDFAASRKMLESCRSKTDKPLGVKLPPYFDGFQFEQMAEVLRDAKVDFIVTINSIGNALVIDPAQEQAVITPNGGFGGLGGQYVKPTALANVHKWHQLADLPVIGVGGVQNGTDAFEHLLAGASVIGIGTQLVIEETPVFARVGAELSDVLDQHGYDSASAAVGRLKPLAPNK